jgi:hypothetical protein
MKEVNYIIGICLFLHHNMNDPTTISNFKRRIERIQSVLKDSKDNALFFHIDKQHNLCQIDDKIKWIINIMGKYSVDYNICYVLPIKDHSGEPKLYSEVGNLKVFIVRVLNKVGSYTFRNIVWSGFYKLISEHYTFNLSQVETYQHSQYDARIKKIYNNLLSRNPTENECNHLKKSLTDQAIGAQAIGDQAIGAQAIEAHAIKSIKLSREYKKRKGTANMMI